MFSWVLRTRTERWEQQYSSRLYRRLLVLVLYRRDPEIFTHFTVFLATSRAYEVLKQSKIAETPVVPVRTCTLVQASTSTSSLERVLVLVQVLRSTCSADVCVDKHICHGTRYQVL
jgi:hypothetical protein